MSDADVERARDQLYALVSAVLRGHNVKRTPPKLSELTANMNADDRADVEERAAILEFDGKLSRDHAERAA